MILIFETQQEHLANLNEVLTHLESAGLCLRNEKCTFCKSEVNYVWHVITADRLKASPNKVKAVSKLSASSKLSELKIILSLVNYCFRFIEALTIGFISSKWARIC